jgi:hypothetical protein
MRLKILVSAALALSAVSLMGAPAAKAGVVPAVTPTVATEKASVQPVRYRRHHHYRRHHWRHHRHWRHHHHWRRHHYSHWRHHHRHWRRHYWAGFVGPWCW